MIPPIYHLIIDPSNKKDKSFEDYFKNTGIQHYFVSNFQEFKAFFTSNADDSSFYEKKIMIWIHPQLGDENQDLKNKSKEATFVEQQFNNDGQLEGKIFYKELSRIPKELQTENLVSLIYGFNDFLNNNHNKIQSFKDIYQIIFKGHQSLFKDNNNTFKCHVLIISALQSEFQSLYRIGLFDVDNQKDSFGCFTNHIESKNGNNIIIKGYPIDNTGMVDAAIHTSRLIEKLNPQYVIMNGVCGGNPMKKRKDGEDKGIWFCDIVIPNKVFTYQKGKVTDIAFEKEPERIEIDTINEKIIGPIKDRCNVIEGNERSFSFQQIIYNSNKSLYEAKGIKELKVLFDSMACGTAVINKKQFFTKEVELQDRNAIALEMESYAVIRACQLAKVTGIIIKSIMDFTTEKADGYKELAEYTSAKMTELVIKEVLQYN